MPENFLRPDRDQQFLLPVDVRDWLPDDDLVWLALDAVEHSDRTCSGPLTALTGRAPGVRPGTDGGATALRLLPGVRSFRELERRCVRDVAFRVITGGHRPDHATIARFRARHETALETVFTEVLRLCAQVGMVYLALLAVDGTKVGADASWSANRTREQLDAEITQLVTAMLAEAARNDAAEDTAFGTARAYEVPTQLADRTDRVARLPEARDRLVAEDAARHAAQQAKIDVWQACKDAGGPRGPGRKPPAEPPGNKRRTEPRANTTDPHARVVRSKNTLIVGYNAQAVVSTGQVIVGATVFQKDVFQKEVDATLLHPRRIQLVRAHSQSYNDPRNDRSFPPPQP
jgi:transposase